MDVNQTFRVAPTVGDTLLKRLDSDGSGDLGAAEIAGRAKFEAAFGHLDTDDSGALSAVEIGARVETHRSRESRPEAMNHALFAAVLDHLGKGSPTAEAAGGGAADAATQGTVLAKATAGLFDDPFAVTSPDSPPAPTLPVIPQIDMFPRLAMLELAPAPEPPPLMTADEALAMLRARP